MSDTAVTYEFERPLMTVDVVMFALIADVEGAPARLHVLLPVRDREPYEGVRGLVGTVIHTDDDEDTHAAARRAALTKLGMDVSHLEQLAFFSGRKRDPRGWSGTLAYIAMAKSPDLSWEVLLDFFPVDMLPEKLAFDHKEIIYWATKRIRNKSSYSTLPLFLMPAEFTISDLQKVYELLMGHEVDHAKLRRKMEDLIEPTGTKTSATRAKDEKSGKLYGGRSAMLFRATTNHLSFFEEITQ